MDLYSFCLMRATLQTLHVDSTLKRRGNVRFHAVSTWNPRGVFVGKVYNIKATRLDNDQKIRKS